MAHWTFFDYIESGGNNPFFSWKSTLYEAESAIDARILQMAGLPKWPEKWASAYTGWDKLVELRIGFKGVQYRPFGTYAPNFSFVLLGGATERDGKIPTATLEIFQRRQQILRANPHYVIRHRIY